MKLGKIDFLNSIPVYLGLERGEVRLPGGVEVVSDKPTALNANLLAGGLDVSPVSSIEYARRHDELVLLPDLSINSHGFIDSVLLLTSPGTSGARALSGTPGLDGTRILVSEASASGHALLSILLSERFHAKAELVRGPVDLTRVGRDVDAALVIGDEALFAARARPDLGKLDLGQEWLEMTGFPMVFAVWCARRDAAGADRALLGAIHRALVASKRWGLSHADAVVETAASRSGLPREFLERYFRNLNYDLDARKIRGLQRFYELARDVGVVSRPPQLSLAEVRGAWT
ncbi:MAG: menaquinone biosynthetic enzyme MqnA/MqnD family protein [Methanobacteriota archaeon]